MSHKKLVIRPFRELAEYRQCERIQQNVWNTVAASGEVLYVTQKHDGMVLGAFDGKLAVGFIYAFLARRHGQLLHWSHMMAVERDYRDRGLGYLMKMEHRKRGLEMGVGMVGWTYDPLQSRNAALNVRRLGAEIDEYLPDCYGHFPSAIERGLPSDRFVALWRMGSARVAERLATKPPVPSIAGLPRVNETEMGAGGMVSNRRLHLNLEDPRILVEIPADTDAMRAADIELAKRWRMETRRIFQRYFAAGYRVDEFIPPAPAHDGRAFYRLARRRIRAA